MEPVDKKRIARCFGKATDSYDPEAVAQRRIVMHLCRLLNRYGAARNGSLLEIGCGTGLLTRRLLKELTPVHADINDLCSEMETHFSGLSDRLRFIAGDAERLTFLQHYDLIASSSALQWFSRPESFLQRMADRLSPNGLLAFSTFGPDNLKEIRTLTGSGLHYRDRKEWEETTGRYFRILYTEEQHLTLRFGGPTDVLRHLRQTGVNGTGCRIRSKGALSEFCNAYRQLFATIDNEVTLTYHPVFLIATTRQL